MPALKSFEKYTFEEHTLSGKYVLCSDLDTGWTIGVHNPAPAHYYYTPDTTPFVHYKVWTRLGSAPGPSGLRPEHLRVALQAAPGRRERALQALTRLANVMAGVPEGVAPYLAGARLHAACCCGKPNALPSWKVL